jgi:hypothetical protein
MPKVIVVRGGGRGKGKERVQAREDGKRWIGWAKNQRIGITK